MVKKLFALASVSALAGLVSAVSAAGCSSETVQTQAPTDAGGATDAKKSDAKTTTPGDDEEDVEPESCLDTTPIDATQFVRPRRCAPISTS